jgi:hypothetical protein
MLACMPLTLGLLACARPHVTLDRVLVKNATANKITEVKIRHEPTQNFSRVNAILPQQSLNIGLTGDKMLGKQAVLQLAGG